MEKIIKKVSYPPKLVQKTQVAAYARVSSGKDAMLHSLSAQVSYYSKLIQNHEGWLYAGVYVDESFTGTKENRDGFQKLLAQCRVGKINMVITKSISRFARNTVTLLQTVRELKSYDVDVYFEEQNIHTMSANGELMMTILASYAQEESLSASENQKWRIHKNFEEGKPWNGTVLGYRYKDGQYVVMPEEANIVKLIFNKYLAGCGTNKIMKELNAEEISTRVGAHWGSSSVMKILKNYSYTGNLLLQRTYRENHLTKRTLENHGELPQYHATQSHEAIIPLETFNEVQCEILRRAGKYAHTRDKKAVYDFSGLIVCGNCGKNYRRKVTATQPVWICSTFNTYGKDKCASKQIPESTLLLTAVEILGTKMFDAEIFHDKVAKICAENGNRLTFYFKDGKTKECTWQDRSRSESWTAEMKQEVAEKSRQRREKLCQEQ